MTNKASSLTGPYVAGDFNYVPPPDDDTPVSGGMSLGLGISIIHGSGATPSKTLTSWVDSDNWVDASPWID